MAPGRVHERDPVGIEEGREVPDLADPVGEVVELARLAKADRGGLEVAAGEAAVRREPLEDNQLLFQAGGEGGVAGRDEPPDVDEAVLLRAHRRAVREVEQRPSDRGDRPVPHPGLPLPNEEGVLGPPAHVEVERDSGGRADTVDGGEVRERHRLAAPGVVRQRDHHERDAPGAPVGEKAGEGRDVHVPLERVRGIEVVRLRDREVDRLRPVPLDVGPGRVEVHVVGDDRSRAGEEGEQEVLGRPPLVRRDHVREPGQLLDGRLEVGEVPAPRVRLVADHHRRPLAVAHRRRPGVGQEVDVHLVGLQLEEVEPRPKERRLAFGRGGEADPLDDFDPVGFDRRPKLTRSGRQWAADRGPPI